MIGPARASGRLGAAVLAVAPVLAWLAFGPRTPDLAAQVYRADLFAAHGFVLYDPAWYAGHHVPAYSLLFPPLGALLGARVVGALAAVAGALCFERLVAGTLGPSARWAARWFAVAVVADLAIGRVTYALGVALGVAALLAWQRARPRAALVLGALCAAASPLAAVFLALGAVAVAVERRRWAPLRLAAVPLACVVAVEAAFPEGGRQPFATQTLVAVLALALASAAVMPPRLRVVRIALGLYAAATAAAFAFASPMGSNVDRLGATLFVPALLIAAAEVPATVRRRGPVLALAAAAAAFQWWSPAMEVRKSIDDPAFASAYYEPLLGFLRRDGLVRGRVEIPFTTAHWEAEVLAPHVELARGWERQLDTRYDALFYDDEVAAPAYERWLHDQAVRFVAVPDVPLDFAGRAEAALVARHPAFLRPVWRSRHWRVYVVRHPVPLVSGPATVTGVGPDRVTLTVRRPARLELRVRWTALWRVSGAGACIAKSRDGFVTVRAARPGVLRLDARLSARGLLRRAPRCARRPDGSGVAAP